MPTNRYDLIVIGAGPGGEVGVIRAAQLGLKVALIEKNEHLGGTCLNVGCIPTKALIESGKVLLKLQSAEEFGFELDDYEVKWKKILQRKGKIVDAQRKGLKFLMKKNKVDVYQGFGKVTSGSTVEVHSESGEVQKLETKNIMLATGSKVRDLPFVKPDGKNIYTSDTILDIDSIPESLCVVGGGVVGMEFACLFAIFGSKVKVVEMAPQIIPFEDAASAKELSRQLKKKGVTILTSAKLKGVTVNKKDCTVEVEGRDPEKFSKVLMSVGRAPVTENMGLEDIGIKTDRGFVPVDAHYRTSSPTVFAIGDIINTPALAHTASAEAIHAVEVIAGHTPPVIDYLCNPSAIYTYPEVASIGHSEETLKEKNIPYEVAQFPFAPLAKAKIEQATEGFVKLLYDPKYKEVLGAHIVHAKATELIAELVLGKILETTVDEIGRAIHPHPTISETVMEAAHVAAGGAIHL